MVNHDYKCPDRAHIKLLLTLINPPTIPPKSDQNSNLKLKLFTEDYRVHSKQVDSL